MLRWDDFQDNFEYFLESFFNIEDLIADIFPVESNDAQVLIYNSPSIPMNFLDNYKFWRSNV